MNENTISPQLERRKVYERKEYIGQFVGKLADEGCYEEKV